MQESPSWHRDQDGLSFMSRRPLSALLTKSRDGVVGLKLATRSLHFSAWSIPAIEWDAHVSSFQSRFPSRGTLVLEVQVGVCAKP